MDGKTTTRKEERKKHSKAERKKERNIESTSQRHTDRKNIQKDTKTTTMMNQKTDGNKKDGHQTERMTDNNR